MDLDLKNFRLGDVKTYRIFFVIYCLGGAAAIAISAIGGFNREHVGLAFLAGSILLVLLARVFKPKNEPAGAPGGAAFKIATVIWLAVLVYSVFLARDSFVDYYLSMPYFVSVGVLALIISYQILGTSKLTPIYVSIVIAEIVVLALFTSASVLYLFPVTIGNDSVPHSNFVYSIIDTGSLNNYRYIDQYAIFPLYHVTFAGLMMLTGISLQAAELALALVQILAVLFVFLLGLKFFNERIALLSTLLIVLSTQMIIPRYSFYPNNYAIIYFLLLLFVLFYFVGKKLNTWPLILVVVLAITLVHPFVMMVTAFTLLAIYTLNKLWGLRKIVDLRYIALSAGLMLVQFVRPIPEDTSLLSKLFYFAEGILLRPNSVTQATSSSFHSWSEILLYDMGFILLILLGVGGALMASKLCQKNNDRASGEWKGMIFSLSSVTLIMTPLPYVLAIVAPNTLPERWFAFTTVFLGLFAAVMIYLLASVSRLCKIVALLVVPVTIFFAITAPLCNPNTHIYLESLSTTPSLTLSEASAAHFFKYHVNLSGLQANSLFALWIDYSLSTEDHYIDPNDMPKVINAGVLVIRDYDLEHGFTIPLNGAKGLLIEIDRPTAAFTRYVAGADEFYDNGDTRAVLGYEVSATRQEPWPRGLRQFAIDGG